MSKFRKKPIEATQWWKNGDHPEDRVGETLPDPISGGEYARQEGAVVRYFRHPDYPGEQVHEACGRTRHEHGWIDGRSEPDRHGKLTVCPGDWVVTEHDGRYLAYRPAVFGALYEPVEEAGE